MHAAAPDALFCELVAFVTPAAAAAVTYDFHRLMPGATLLKCSEFGKAVVSHM